MYVYWAEERMGILNSKARPSIESFKLPPGRTQPTVFICQRPARRWKSKRSVPQIIGGRMFFGGVAMKSIRVVYGGAATTLTVVLVPRKRTLHTERNMNFPPGAMNHSERKSVRFRPLWQMAELKNIFALTREDFSPFYFWCREFNSTDPITLLNAKKEEILHFSYLLLSMRERKKFPLNANWKNLWEKRVHRRRKKEFLLPW